MDSAIPYTFIRWGVNLGLEVKIQRQGIEKDEWLSRAGLGFVGLKPFQYSIVWALFM